MSDEKNDLIYEVMEEFGEFPYSAYAIKKGDAPPEWIFIPHSRYDGIGGLYYLWKASGYSIPDLAVKERKPIAFMTKLKAFLKLTKEDRRKRNQANPDKVAWEKYNGNNKHIGKPCAISWFLFTEEETKKITELIKKHHASPNSYLLLALNKAVNATLITESKPNIWTTSVNMRGLVKKSDMLANNISEIRLTIQPTSTSKEIKMQFMHALKDNQHWANYWQMNIMRWLGKKFTRKLMQRVIAEAETSNLTGQFSYLGDYDFRKDNKRDEIFFGCTPVFCFSPVGASAGIWNGRLTMALTIHRVLTEDPTIIQACLEEWKKQILQGV